MTRADRSDSLSGLLRVAVAGLVWGTIPLVLRAADGSSLVKVFYRVVFAGLTTFAWMALAGRLGEFRLLGRRKLAQIVGQGAILCLNWVLFLSALDMTKVAVAELLGYTGPVFVAALAPFVSREPYDRRIVLPLALALGGIAVILAPQGLSVSGGRETLGALLAFGSALTYATLLLRAKDILRGVGSGPLQVIEYGTATLLLAPFVAWAYAHGQGPSSIAGYGALVTLGVVHTAASGLLFLSGLRRVRTDHAAVLMYAEPVSAVFFAAAFLGEPITAATLIGGAMVVAGGARVAALESAPPLEIPEAREGGREGSGTETP